MKNCNLSVHLALLIVLSFLASKNSLLRLSALRLVKSQTDSVEPGIEMLQEVANVESRVPSFVTLGDVSPVVLFTRMDILFKLIDRDSNKVIEAPELDDWFKTIDKGAARLLFDRELRYSDDDHDGNLSYDEFMSSTFAFDKDSIQTKKIFNELDSNKDNVLDEEELPVLFTAKSVPSVMEATIRSMMQKRTSKWNGTVKLSDYLHDNHRFSDEELAIFEQCDANADGYIQLKEAAQAVLAIKRLRFDSFFRSIGLDPKTGITIEQWKEHHQAIAVSPITHMGLLFQHPSYFELAESDSTNKAFYIAHDEL